MNPFLTYFVLSIVASVVWTFLLLKAKQLNRQSLGLAGAYVASLVLASLGQAEAFAWLWKFHQLMMFVWLIAIILLVAAAAATWSVRQPLRLPLVFCVVIIIVANVVAVLHFLWLATVSPAGV